MCEGGELRGKGVFVLEKAAIAISGAINEQVCSRDEKTREQLLRLILIEIFISWIGRVSILKGVAIRRIARMTGWMTAVGGTFSMIEGGRESGTEKHLFYTVP